MMLNIIEKQRAHMLACEHPFLKDARLTEQTLNTNRAEYLQVKTHMSNKLELAAHTFVEAHYADDKVE